MAYNSRTGYGFGLGGPSPDLNPRPIIANRAPVAADIGYELMTQWLDTTTQLVYILTNIAAGVATWSIAAAGTTDLETLTGDAGGAITPVGSNITLTGGTNIATTGAAGAITFNLDDQIELTSVECGTNLVRVSTYATNEALIQAFADDDTAAGASTRTAIYGNMQPTAGDGNGTPNAVWGSLDAAAGSNTLQVNGVYGLCTQEDGSVIASTAAGIEGHLNLLETDIADLPAVYAFGVKAYLDAADTTAVPAGLVAGVGSIVEYNTPFDAKAYGVAVSRLDSGAGAGTAGQAAFGVVQGTVAIADWLYGLDLYNGAAGVAYTNADIRLQNQAILSSDTTGGAFSGDLSVRSCNPINTNIASFDVDPILQSNATTGAAPTGATGDYNIMYLQDRTTIKQFILGAGQTIIAPRLEDDGLLISLDLTTSEGAEYYFGHTTRSRHAFTIGTDPAFFMEASFKVADCGTSDPLFMGFRAIAAPNAAYTTYTDAAFIGLRNTTAADVVVLGTNLNSAGYTYTNTTDAWADGETHILRVNVDATGNVTYLIDGVAPSVTAAFQFDNADVVIPCIHHLFAAAGVPAAIHIQSLKVGLQAWN